MARYHYTTTMDGAKAVGRDLPISVKHSVEVCRFIRGKKVETAKKILENVVAKKCAIPYKRYNWDVGHKPGMASGRYPKKTSQEILKIIESAEINAQFKGMNTSKLHIAHIAAHRAASPMHGGRMRGRTMKRAHVEIVLQEREEKKRKRKVKTVQKESVKAAPAKTAVQKEIKTVAKVEKAEKKSETPQEEKNEKITLAHGSQSLEIEQEAQGDEK